MKKVIVGLSGGVDSAVAIILLKKAGYDVEGLFMRNWDSSLNQDILGNPNDPNDICPQEKDYLDALNVSKQLGIKLHRIDFVEEYWNNVFMYFLDEYKNNRTPNPDIICNKEIKFKAFLNKALELGSDYIAMGHYARSIHTPEILLLRGLDQNKDQSYFLCQLTNQQIAKTLFPLGELTKKEVRQIALDYNLVVATKKDSTGICFIGERHFKKFLENYLPHKPGPMLNLEGKKVGNHDGLMYYTIGQRHGLGLGGAGEAWFVIGKDLENNALLVGQGYDNPLLYSNRCLVDNLNWLYKDKVSNCTAKFRYRQKDLNVTLEHLSNQEVIVHYPNLARAVTPGQTAVFYLGDIVLGGGTIKEVYMDKVRRSY